MRALFVNRIVNQLCTRLNLQYVKPQSAFWRDKTGLLYALTLHSHYASTLSGVQRRVKHASYRLYETRYERHFGTSKSMRKVKYYYRPAARDFCLSIFLDHQIAPCDFLLNTRKKEAKAFQNWLDENHPETREDTFEGRREGFLLHGAGPGLDQVDAMLSPEFFKAFKALQKHLMGREPRIIVRRRTDRGRPAQSILILIRSHRALGAPHICSIKSEEAALKDAQVQIELVETLVAVLRGDVKARAVHASKPSYTPQIRA
ncbi:hypothetical protein [Woodsholea maritima]|uniref:hypothetical protein n=1 Tax=Woodsholea maritima TaxID=240237 RepID=UPI0003A632CC|nr:hypothetical protein [Woodsholea maritima]